MSTLDSQARRFLQLVSELGQGAQRVHEIRTRREASGWITQLERRGKSIQWRRIGSGKAVSAAQAKRLDPKRLEEDLNEVDREILSESGKVKGDSLREVAGNC